MNNAVLDISKTLLKQIVKGQLSSRVIVLLA